MQRFSSESATEHVNLASLFIRMKRLLTSIANARISPLLSQRVEAEDIVQSVFRTVLRRHGAGQLLLLNEKNAEHLLAKITSVKARRAARYNMAARRTPCLESQNELAGTWATQTEDDSQVIHDDLKEQLLASSSPHQRQILELRIQGYSVTQIAEEIKISRQTVYRNLHVLSDRFRRLAGE